MSTRKGGGGKKERNGETEERRHFLELQVVRGGRGIGCSRNMDG